VIAQLDGQRWPFTQARDGDAVLQDGFVDCRRKVTSEQVRKRIDDGLKEPDKARRELIKHFKEELRV
jgi:hypothetical protein